MKTPRIAREKTTARTTTMTPTMRESEAASMSAIQRFGPCQVGGGVMFVASYPQANAVHIAGDFNDWQPEKTPMRKASDGTWQVRIPLAKGVYSYRLVVDGQWQQDPCNNATEPNPYGGMNSVVRVD